MFVALCESAVHEGRKFVFKSSQEITEEDVVDYVREEIPEEYYYGDGDGDYDYEESSLDFDNIRRSCDEDEDEDEDWDCEDEECCYIDVNEIKEVVNGKADARIDQRWSQIDERGNEICSKCDPDCMLKRPYRRYEEDSYCKKKVDIYIEEHGLKVDED